jgi:hypothetical protein
MSNISNADIYKVSSGMMRVVDALGDLKKSEKHMILSSVFNCLYNSKLSSTYAVSDVMEMVDNMRFEAKRIKVPEFGGAERYIKGEL